MHTSQGNLSDKNATERNRKGACLGPALSQIQGVIQYYTSANSILIRFKCPNLLQCIFFTWYNNNNNNKNDNKGLFPQGGGAFTYNNHSQILSKTIAPWNGQQELKKILIKLLTNKKNNEHKHTSHCNWMRKLQ